MTSKSSFSSTCSPKESAVQCSIQCPVPGDDDDEEQRVAGVEMDRLAFITTALIALPGNILRTFFAPVLNVKRIMFNRRRLTQECISSGPDVMEKMYLEAIRILTKVLVDASHEILEAPIPLDEKELAAALRGKLTPACYEPGAVLAYPSEFPEAMFVHVVLKGGVQVVNYQPQNRKGPMFESNMKKQYFISNDVIRLNGSLGFQPELLKLLNNHMEPVGDGVSDVASTSNVSTAIHRSLRRASRMIGQPTLLATRTEFHRAPYVCCAAEALGFEPFGVATVTAEANAPSGKGERAVSDSRVTQTMRIRSRDLHNALIELATTKFDSFKPSRHTSNPARHLPTLADHITAARIKAISRHYPMNEILMRQSWLLQDTPGPTIRALAAQLIPNSYYPGDVILCPHSGSRQLCFLRRGTMTIEEAPEVNVRNMGTCQCANYFNEGKILQVVPSGTSFGELSVLFSEPRVFILRAQTVCDVWYLSHHCFASTVRRDEVLRESFLSKAAALRIRWLREQRFTSSLAQKLREYCELFREAPDSFIRLVQERIEPVVYPPGTLLTSTSTRCQEMLIILHGRVTSIVDGVAEYGPGSVIGEANIIPHRWPFGLVSRSMVEGWKLRRNQLRDVLKRIEILRNHSGEVGAHVSQLMQRVFAPPIPFCEVDALGRSKVPLVGPPPRGRTYLEYAEYLGEVQMKAFCFRYSDYVKWSDISYSLHNGEHGVEPSNRSSMIKKKASTSSKTPGVLSVTEGDTNAVSLRKKSRECVQKRHVVTSGNIFPFYVNSVMVHRPFARPTLRRPPDTIDDSEDSFLDRHRALNARRKSQSLKKSLPHLEGVVALLDARKKLQKVADSRQTKMTEVEKERMNLADVAHYSVSLANGVGGFPPTHIFLHGSNPRVQITVEEAINIGYVLQFPDAERIQSCVSNIDSDVTIGLPQHWQRRRDMAFTPNARHHRRCFLFAASQLGDKTVDEVLLREDAADEAENREKTQQLTTLLKAKFNEMHGQNSSDAAGMSVGEIQSRVHWNKMTPSQLHSSSPSLSREGLSPNVGPLMPSHKPPPLKETDEEVFLHQMMENPEKAICKIRLKFQLPLKDDYFGGIGEVPNNSCGSSIHDTAASSKDTLLGRLRRISLVREEMKPDVAAAGLPPRLPCTNSEDKGPNTAVSDAGNLMKSFLKQDDAPLFIDGYGVLGELQSTDKTNFHSCEDPVVDIIVPDDHGKWSRSSFPSRRNTISFSDQLHQCFVMPSVKEAMATIRNIQCDVDGLNAISEEQRRERMLRACHQRENTGEFDLKEGFPSAEHRRMLEEWTASHREHARSHLCPSTIPSFLLLEAGHDYLSEELRLARRQNRMISASKNVEVWRTTIDELGGQGVRSREETRGGAEGDLLVLVGSRKFGVPSKPLRNPVAHLSDQEYQEWVTERDAMFSSAAHERLRGTTYRAETMVDCTEWLESTLGTNAHEDELEWDSARQLPFDHTELAAVLCLVDCQLSMFRGRGGRDSHLRNNTNDIMMGSAASTAAANLKTEFSGSDETRLNHSTGSSSCLIDNDVVRRPRPPPLGVEEVTEEDRCGSSDMSRGCSMTPFQTALRSLLKLYQDKLISSSRDVVALVLYNTKTLRNPYSFPGVYVFHHFAPPSLHSALELEELAAAGTVPSAGYNLFTENIGHAQCGECRLSDTLWAAQHMLLSFRLSGIVSRRIFLFTDDNVPHHGDTLEMKRCLVRVRDFPRAGMVLDAFIIGANFEADTDEGNQTEKERDILDGIYSSCDNSGDGHGDVLQAPRTSVPSASVPVFDVYEKRCFPQDEFWEELRRAVPDVLQLERQRCVYAPRVSTEIQEVDDMLNSVRRRGRVQRPYQNSVLSIGVSVDGRPVPTIAVSVYYPLMPAKLQSMRLVDGCTSEDAMRRVHVEVSTPLPVDEKSKDFVVDTGKPQWFTVVGGRNIAVSPREKRRIIEASTGVAASVGFSILCFKHTEDILQHKHVVRMPNFLHPNLREGGEKSRRLFVRLTQCLVQKNKVAVAQFIASRGGAPRLVALVPSVPSSLVPSCSLPVKGLGLYVVPLPYAEDIRSVPSLPCFCSETIPSQNDMELAKCVVSSLSVSYDINTVPNPSLQLRYKILQDTAKQSAMGTTAITTTALEAEPDNHASESRMFEDFSLPDRRGMACYAQLFHEFNKNVLLPSYEADVLCLPPRCKSGPCGKLPRKENSEEELGGGDNDALIHLVEAAFVRNSLQTLTLVQLKAYLRAVGESAGGARRKDDVVQHVTRVLKRQR